MNTATHQRCPCEWGMGGMGYGVKKVKGLEFGVLQNTVASADCITGGVQLAEDWERREARAAAGGRGYLPWYVDGGMKNGFGGQPIKMQTIRNKDRRQVAARLTAVIIVAIVAPLSL